MTKQKKLLPVASLLLGAAIWGVAWYPYRLLEQAGMRGELSTTLAYSIALLIGLILFRRQLRISEILNPAAGILFWISLSAGWTGIAYVLGIIHGEVMRVLLLFYLAPLWTILFSRILLQERLSRQGYAIILLSLAGALLLLWQPGSKLPLLASYGDWMGLSGGLAFALTNVLIRKDQQHGIQLKLLAVLSGTALTGFAATLLMESISDITHLHTHAWLILAGIGGLVFFLCILLQYGMTHIPANQAIVIMLFELVAAAIAAYFLTNEYLTGRDWAGGLMIASASLFSARVNRD
ncbi:DMT family transporter [Nitrosomonas sp. H1_AOB3]|uniref:DMT family transporter n=1 Tax=Nitrosomonas sp. H1_AOB3 TaxID=2741553 RepID=UPI001936ACF4|nr:DMT family transporter [Nitrosomonas sp. H1_AOB3]QOJ09986.1 MAG: DMT family transporter [Nitrosomonas sp. H1_AOB3]HNR10463.1 DMT family transporter [Nitrosomonas europaea]